jgi:hypothetical protein
MIVKLKKQVEILKKELSDATLAYERLRSEANRDKVKWRAGESLVPSARSNMESAKLINKLQSILDSERADFKRERLRMTRELEDARRLITRRQDRGRRRSPFAEMCSCNDIYYMFRIQPEQLKVSTRKSQNSSYVKIFKSWPLEISIGNPQIHR